MVSKLLDKLRRGNDTEQTDDQDEADDENDPNKDIGGVNNQWGQSNGLCPDELPDTATAAVTPVSASSAQLLVQGARFGETFCKVMYVPRGGWPPEPFPGMIDRLTTHSSAGVQVKLRVDPMDDDRAASEFKRRVSDKQKEVYSKQQSSAPDLAVAQDELDDLRDVLRSVKGGQESVYWVGCYFVIRAGKREQVDEAADELRRALRKDDVDVTSADWIHPEGMTTVSPVGKFELPETTRTPMTGGALGYLFPFSTGSIVEEGGVLHGYHALNESPVFIDRWNRENGYNRLVIGNIGAGKSVGEKLVDTRRLARDRDVSAVFVDPRGGFSGIVDAFGDDAETVTVGGKVGINPLQIEPTPQNVLKQRPDMDPLAEKAESVLATFEAFHSEGENSDGLTPQERTVLSQSISDAYRNAGITKDPSTHGRDSPLISDVDTVLKEYAKDPQRALGDDPADREIEKWADAAADLRMAMHAFGKGGRYEHLNRPTDIGLVGSDRKRIVLLDLQQSESTGNMPLTMKLVFDAIYERAKKPGKMMAVFDEAHHFMQNPGGLDYLERGTRYSRHFDLALTLISQTADEFFVNDKAKTIADNCPIKWLFRTTGLTEEDAEHLGLTGRQRRFVRQATPGDRTRGWSHSLLKVDDVGSVPVRVEAVNDFELNVVDPKGAPIETEGADGTQNRSQNQNKRRNGSESMGDKHREQTFTDRSGARTDGGRRT